MKSEITESYQLLLGVFTANKTNKRFSTIHLGQNHEQMNDTLKHNGGIEQMNGTLKHNGGIEQMNET